VAPGVNPTRPSLISFLRDSGHCGLIAGCAIAGHAADSRAAASSREIPGRSRASARSQKLPRPSSPASVGLTAGSAATAIVTSAVAPTLAPVKPRGLTPTMSAATPFSTIVRPTTPGSRANARSQ
jgi:hypothetical protein